MILFIQYSFIIHFCVVGCLLLYLVELFVNDLICYRIEVVLIIGALILFICSAMSITLASYVDSQGCHETPFRIMSAGIA